MKSDCSCYCDYPNFNHYHKNGTWKCVDRFININNHDGYKTKTHCKSIFIKERKNQMNKVELVGRLTKDPEIRLTNNQTQFCGFTLAVDRRFKDSNGERQADFINCIAWKERAVFIQKYFHKGSRIGICGSIQTRTYDDNDGKTVFVTEVVVDEAEFVESATKPSEPNQTAPVANPEQKIADVAPTAPSTLPFEI